MDASDRSAFCARTNETMRTAKSCGPDTPTLVSSLAEAKSAQPGADQPYPQMTVAKKPITGESTRINR
jgi:hypothetical protein